MVLARTRGSDGSPDLTGEGTTANPDGAFSVTGSYCFDETTIVEACFDSACEVCTYRGAENNTH